MIDFPRPPEWTERASCAEVGGDMFWPEPGDRTLANTALRVCRRCAVRAECLAYALDNDERHGIWGGMKPLQRRRMEAA